MTTGGILGLLAIGALFFFMMKKGGGCCGGHKHGDQDGHSGHGGTEGSNDQGAAKHLEGTEANFLKDPVCGMTVNQGSATLSSEHLGKTFHFCSEHCKNKFDTQPDKFIG